MKKYIGILYINLDFFFLSKSGTFILKLHPKREPGVLPVEETRAPGCLTVTCPKIRYISEPPCPKETRGYCQK
jgi:hypothetical protein